MNVTNITWILQIISTVAIGIITFWLRDWKSKTEELIKNNACDIRNVEKSLTDLRIQLPRDYTTREDHIRAMANLEKRVEIMSAKVEQSLKDINSKLEQNLKDINAKLEQKIDGYFSSFGQKIEKLEEHLNEHILKKEG